MNTPDAPYEVEVPDHVVDSVLDIRREITRVIGEGGLAADLTASLRTIRAACRKFLEVRHDGWRHRVGGFGGSLMSDIEFNQALGELRGVVGAEVAKIAAANGLDVEDQLASIPPAADTDPM